MNKFSWIGYDVDILNGCIFGSVARIEKLCSDLDGICAKLELSAFVHVRKLHLLLVKLFQWFQAAGMFLKLCRGICTILLILVVHGIQLLSFVINEGREEFDFWRGKLRVLNGVLFWHPRWCGTCRILLLEALVPR